MIVGEFRGIQPCVSAVVGIPRLGVFGAVRFLVRSTDERLAWVLPIPHLSRWATAAGCPVFPPERATGRVPVVLGRIPVDIKAALLDAIARHHSASAAGEAGSPFQSLNPT